MYRVSFLLCSLAVYLLLICVRLLFSVYSLFVFVWPAWFEILLLSIEIPLYTHSSCVSFS